MDLHSLRRIGFGLMVVIVLACAVVITATESTRATSEAQRADEAESSLTSTQAELDQAKADLSTTTGSLGTTRRQLTTTSRSLSRATEARDTLTHRMHACRYLVKINDHLLYGMTAQGRATGQLIKHYPNQRMVKKSLHRAGQHARAIMRLSKRAGYHTISGVVNACSPPRR